MVVSLRVTFRKTLLLIVCFTLVSVLILTSGVFTNIWLPTAQQFVNKRTFLTHNDADTIVQRYAQEESAGSNGAVAEWLLALTTKPKPDNRSAKDWYFRGGIRRPQQTTLDKLRLLPEQADEGEDRIQEQLMYVPKGYDESTSPMKTIVLWNGFGAWNVRSGSVAFEKCPVNRCTLDNAKSKAKDADALLFKDSFAAPIFPRSKHQIWILYLLECPYHTSNFARLQSVVNWTATYRVDSDIVAPYERWTYFDPNVREKPQHKDYAANKTKKVAWFVSNCGAKNNRLAFANELSKYIQVDIYGACGSLSCPRSSGPRCFDLLNEEYKFYLAFENSNCKDYITEKFFVNGLQHDVVPVVMGARPSEYERAAPQHSYIHTDDFENAAELAKYLHQLDNDDELYNAYFKWKGTGEFINTYFWCRLCAMLHAPLPHKTYKDVNEWWRGKGVCTKTPWSKSDQN